MTQHRVCWLPPTSPQCQETRPGYKRAVQRLQSPTQQNSVKSPVCALASE